jgi:rubrerythrin
MAAWIDAQPAAGVVGVGADVAQSSAPAWECRFCGYSTTAFFQPKCPKCGIGMSRKF